LTHYIDWSWWYVTLPFWGGLALVISLFLFGAFIWGSLAVTQALLKKRNQRINSEFRRRLIK
jgi:hypothetical protein